MRGGLGGVSCFSVFLLSFFLGCLIFGYFQSGLSSILELSIWVAFSQGCFQFGIFPRFGGFEGQGEKERGVVCAPDWRLVAVATAA